MEFNRKQFFDSYCKAFGPLQQRQVDGLEFLLSKIEADTEWKSIPEIAYFLATIKHETGVSRNGVEQTFQPIRELRAKAGSKGRANQDRYWLSGYYGRGYIQLTWKDNYAKFGLADVPDDALQPDTSYMIASRGMRRGMFTKFKLSDFINANEVDYHNARRVVNGLDKAEKIVEHAQKFERILRSAVVKQDEPFAKSLVEENQSVEAAPKNPKADEPAKPESSTGTAEQPESGVATVQKVAQSVGSKIMSGGTLGAGILSAVAGAFLGIIKNPYAFAILILGSAAIAAYLWNQSKNRQLELQKDLNAKAASTELNTVQIKPPAVAAQ